MPSEPTPIDESSYTPPSAEERPKLMRTLDDVRAELNEDGWTWAVAILDKHQSALDALAVAVKPFAGFIADYESEWRDGEWGHETADLKRLQSAIEQLLQTRETSNG